MLKRCMITSGLLIFSLLGDATEEDMQGTLNNKYVAAP